LQLQTPSSLHEFCTPASVERACARGEREARRIFFIRHALRAGFTIEEIFNLTKIDRWFLAQIKEIVDFEEELATAN
jgi:hypothetical protein